MQIYLDHNSTTPVDSRVVEAMLPFFQEAFANPSSAHTGGAIASRAIESARFLVAELVGTEPEGITFCSSATEAINTVIASTKGKIVTTVVEHAATLSAVERMERTGTQIVRLSVDRDGQLDLDELGEAIEGAALVSILWANNETGAISPIERIANLCASRSVPLHVDAVQAAGKLPIDLREVPIDFLSISAHKMNGPKGIAALITGGKARVKPLLVGGHQEGGRRAGTENVPGIVGFGAAASLALKEMAYHTDTVMPLRDRLETSLVDRLHSCWVNASNSPRLANTSNIGFADIDGDNLAAALDGRGIYVSTGSACHANATEPSHVVHAMTHSYDAARSSVRFSLGHSTTLAEIDYVIDAVVSAVAEMR